MAAGLTKWKERVASLQRSNAMARVRKRGEQLQHTLVATGAAYAFGSIERRAQAPLPTVFGLDPKLSWGAFFAVVATAVKGRMGQMAAATSDGLLSAYGYHAGLGKGYTLQGEGDDMDL
ncbi:MAG: hypothetical protein OEZ01_00615 [Candidatus Heimdallarchaeota archaeon]|nr:hypothetical protein [Candidatus Heimdallarchaeota archaeon]MDH5676624.1 hypothetical protein [Myxococcales bacterium]